jgi:hypothetical protein
MCHLRFCKTIPLSPCAMAFGYIRHTTPCQWIELDVGTVVPANSVWYGGRVRFVLYICSSSSSHLKSSRGKESIYYSDLNFRYTDMGSISFFPASRWLKMKKIELQSYRPRRKLQFSYKIYLHLSSYKKLQFFWKRCDCWRCYSITFYKRRTTRRLENCSTSNRRMYGVWTQTSCGMTVVV